jgi:arsenite methyltransferase
MSFGVITPHTFRRSRCTPQRLVCATELSGTSFCSYGIDFGLPSIGHMGCGRGAVLTAVARRLSSDLMATGRVTGVDIWSKKDQSGNAREVTLRNASLEEVSDRVQIDTGDMRALPYPDATFDLVVSSLAIHNIRSNGDRKRAVVEGFRVLKPGGRIVIADIRTTAMYEETLRALGAANVERRRLGWRFWWGNPVAGTTLVTASKALA